MKKFKGMEIMQEIKNVIVCYSQFDMGLKYKIYKKNVEFNHYEYVIAFGSIGEAFNYANKIYQ